MAGLRRAADAESGGTMIRFEEELSKFHRSLEVEEVQDTVYQQDLTDMTDIMVRMMKDGLENGKAGKNNMTIPKL